MRPGIQPSNVAAEFQIDERRHLLDNLKHPLAVLALVAAATGAPNAAWASIANRTHRDQQRFESVRLGATEQINIAGTWYDNPVLLGPQHNIVPAPETSPWTLQIGTKHEDFLSTDHTISCMTPTPLTANEIDCNNPVDDRLITGGSVQMAWFNAGSPPHNVTVPSNTIWNRNYSGMFSAQLARGGDGIKRVIAFLHGENKNECLGYLTNCYQNTVSARIAGKAGNLSVATCAEVDFQPALRQSPCWPAYYAFVNMASTAAGSQKWRFSGPIVWPTRGYSGYDGGHGVRHPYSITAGNYVYVTYLDESNPSGGCVEISRAPVSTADREHAYTTYVGDRPGKASIWRPALPQGLNAANAGQSRYLTYNSKEKAVCILPHQPGRTDYSFEIARMKTTRKSAPAEYVGVAQEGKEGADMKDVIFESRDMVHWRRDEVLPVAGSGADWSKFEGQYPIFMNHEGASNNTIGNDFYLLTTYNGRAMRTPVNAKFTTS